MELKDLFVVFHLLGVAFGLGGALASDSMFLKALKDLKISKVEMGFLQIGSAMVWLGLAILIISGYLLFSLDTDGYLNSDKFLAKMTIVGIILLNGLFLHTSLIPRLRRHIEGHLPSSDEFMRKRPFLFTSGAVSLVSWLSALTLGALHKVSWTYGEIMGVYLLILLIAGLVANLLGRHLLP
ncbi:MAG: hypothetical protein HYW38_02420, partial [Candidatus Colwellbacteria bacterium]|nr:hypothetical protein [Candidatus Colwellbacteria bacterium]